jgi:bifunctional non-homologous end joining protein LigD
MAKRKLADYERKRSFDKTPEPRGRKGSKPKPTAKTPANRFVIQEHHARRIHWDLRLERDGVLASWALPRGVPPEPKDNRLAVRTEDHPLEYLDFHGEIPKGSYGAGTMEIWDRGTYSTEEWNDKKVTVDLHGERVRGRYALFATKAPNWMIHRMDPPAGPTRDPLPDSLKPMLATLGKRLPRNEDDYAYELKWDGVRALAYCEPGRVRLESRNLRDVSSQYPEVTRALREALGSTQALVDGEVVAFDEDGRPDFQRLQRRMHLASESAVRRRMAETAATYIAFDVLHLEGHSLLQLPYTERRELLERLELDGPSLQSPSHHLGDANALLELTRERGLEGLVAKRLDSTYQPGRRSRDWIKIKNVRTTELVVGGWIEGQGGRAGRIGALLVGYHDDEGGLHYAGRVGTGFTDRTLEDLGRLLTPIERPTSPFTGRQPPREARFVEPKLVAEVEFNEWTRAGTLRAPSFKGLRDDVDAAGVRREGP